MPSQNLKKFNSGLLPNPFDPRDVWLDEVRVGGSEPLPASFRIDGLTFEPQGASPYCASFATTKIFEQKIRNDSGVIREFSQPHLFFHSGGTVNGSYFRANLETAKEKGCVSYETFPMPSDVFDPPPFDTTRLAALGVPFTKSKKILGYVRVQPDREILKRAIMEEGPLMVGVAATGGYWQDKQKRASQTDNHACLLVGWDEEDNWWLFDSLQPSSTFDGYHRVDRAYGFNSAYAITKLPKDWKDQRDETRKDPYQFCLNHYDKQRNLEAEIMAAEELLREFKKFNNQSVLEAAGRFWTVLVNMRAYGGYNVSYTKWGRWMPGDIINQIFQWRRTGQLIFDPNKLRSEYP